jgi:lipoprotein-releasing system ATP-binding protein
MLRADRITKTFPTRGGELGVLCGASLTLHRGQSAAILGPSGSGKSTFLNIVGTLESPTSGKVTLDDVDPFSLDERQLARFRSTRIGFVFQDHHLLPQLNVLENVLLPTLVGDSDQSIVDRACSLLDRVGLADRLDHRPAELSGGERQRVAIARALVNRPSLLLADEPTGNLDRRTAESISELLLELHRTGQTMLIVVTHSDLLAAKFDRRLTVQEGALVANEG